MQNIDDIIEKLKVLGYSNNKIEEIISNCIADKNISALSEQELEELKYAMQKQIDFAKRCLNMVSAIK